MRRALERYWTEDAGQTLTEYALILALISLGLMLVLIFFGDELGSIYNTLTGHLKNTEVEQVPAT